MTPTPPTLLLMHGAGLCGGVFDPIVDALGGRAHCVAPDLRGHGRNPTLARAEDHALAAQADELVALLDDLELARVALLGHSYGGAVALHAALDHPDRFGPLWFHEPAIGNPLDPPDEAAERSRDYERRVGQRRSTWPSAEAMYDELRKWRPYGEFSDDFLDALVRSGTRPTEGGGVELACDPQTEGLLFMLTLTPLGGNGLVPRLPELAGRDDVTLTVGTFHQPRLELFTDIGQRMGHPVVTLKGAHFAIFHSLGTTLELIEQYLGIGRQA